MVVTIIDTTDMAVTVRFFANFRDAAGKDCEVVEKAADVASLLDQLCRRFGGNLAKLLFSSDKEELREDMTILVNGKPIRLLNGINTPLKEGDVVAIFPPVAGGAKNRRPRLKLKYRDHSTLNRF